MSDIRNLSPRELGLPHDNWRDSQYDCLSKVYDKSTKDGGFIFAELPTGCHDKNQKVILGNGELDTVDNIKVGDVLMGDNNDKRTVLSLCRGRGSMYRIIPDEGNSFIVNYEHILTLLIRDHILYDSIVDIKVSDYLSMNKGERRRYRLFKSPLELGETKFDIEYIGEDNYYGFILDGNHRYLLDDFTVTHNSGKTSIPAALSSVDNVTAVVQTLGLLDQYEREYGFAIIKGKQEYPCVQKSKVNKWRTLYHRVPTVAECHLTNMYDCSAKCPYLKAKEKAMNSKRMACTYRYAALSPVVYERSGILVMDEAHLAGDELLSFASFEIDEHFIKEWKLPKPPIINKSRRCEGALVTLPMREKITEWFAVSIATIWQTMNIFDMMSLIGAKRRKAYDLLYSALTLFQSSKEWFYYCGPNAQYVPKWTQQDFFPKEIMSLRPLTPAPIANKLFDNKHTKVLMSATIGNPKPLANELGITEYDYYTYPHPIPIEYRPVTPLSVPKMTKANLERNPSLYKIQALLIRNWIRSHDSSWRGIILTTSNYKVSQLKKHLEPSFGDRIFNIEDLQAGVSKRIDKFINDDRESIIAIDTIQGWGSGLDLREDLARMVVVAGVPHSNPSDKYEQARMNRKGGRAYSLWTAYNAVPQACGRVSRGEKDEHGNWIKNVAAIADGSALTKVAMSYYPMWFRQAIINKKL